MVIEKINESIPKTQQQQQTTIICTANAAVKLKKNKKIKNKKTKKKKCAQRKIKIEGDEKKL